MPTSRIRIIVEIGLTVALAWALNLIKLWEMPQGGSVSLVMLPIIVLALMRGVGPGIIAGALYGMVDAVWNPQIFYPAQFFLDYPVAFGLLGLAGLFSKTWNKAVAAGKPLRGIWTAVLPGTIVAVLARYCAHVMSGIIFFANYAPPGTPAWVYSAAYNSFALVAGVVTFAAAAIVMPALSRALGQGRAR